MAILNLIGWLCVAFVAFLIAGLFMVAIFQSTFWAVVFPLAFFAQLFKHKATVIVFLAFIAPVTFGLALISDGQLGLGLLISLTILVALIPAMLTKAFILRKTRSL